MTVSRPSEKTSLDANSALQQFPILVKPYSRPVTSLGTPANRSDIVSLLHSFLAHQKPAPSLSDNTPSSSSSAPISPTVKSHHPATTLSYSSPSPSPSPLAHSLILFYFGLSLSPHSLP